jgi:ubiquitin carboxyl-terminal hydrolase 4/11/15
MKAFFFFFFAVDVEKVMREKFNIHDNKEVRLWNKYMSNTYEQLSKPDQTLQEAGLYPGQIIVIEQQNEDGTWPRQAKR